MVKTKTIQKGGNLFPNVTLEPLRKYVKIMLHQISINHPKRLQKIQRDENLWGQPI